jgi:hypothetical protein
VTHRTIALDAALAVAALNGIAGLYGLARWYRSAPSRAFWLTARAAQALAVAYAVLAGVYYLAGYKPASGLFYLYALLPIAIGVIAEQFRILSAEHVLAQNELADAQAVGELAPNEQQEVVLAILRRELLVIALACVVVCFLALRAWGTY